MKDFSEPLYGSQQIFIPPTFPHVLKIYAKAAIRTQPYDLLTWSASYFRALSEGRSPPVKNRIEYPLIKSKGGLSPGYLKLLIKQLSDSPEVEKQTLRDRWTGVCLEENELKQILCLTGAYKESSFALYKFVAVAAGFISKSLTQTMIMLCDLYTDEPDGGSAAISSDLFVDLYTFLASIDASQERKYIDGFIEGTHPTGKTELEDDAIDTKDLSAPTEIVNDELRQSDEMDEFKATSDSEKIFSSNEIASSENEDNLPPEKLEIIINTSGKYDESEEDGNKEECSDEDKAAFLVISNDTHTEESDNVDSSENFQKEGNSTQDDESDLNNEENADKDESDDEDILSMKHKSFEVLHTDSDDVNEKSSDENGTNVKNPVLLRVFSEDGQKIASLSAMSNHEETPTYLQINKDGELFVPKKDVSVEDREAIIEQLQKKKDEKVKDMEAVLESLEDLAEKSRTLTVNADLLSNQKTSDASNDFIKATVEMENTNNIRNIIKNDSSDSGKIEVDPNAKGVVNPIFKGLFDNVADRMGVVRAFQVPDPIVEHEVIIVPAVPGIGPAVDEDMIEEFLRYVRETAADQCDMFMPRDIRHYFCPPLEKI